jgi:pimeloyl-ACP methyl ester carboxylesterase
LDLPRVDVLGFSIGGYVAQAFTLRYPETVRRLILVGTAPRGGEQEGTHPDVPRVAQDPVLTREDFLFLFFEPSATSQAAGIAFWERRHRRTLDVDPPSSEQTMNAQTTAIGKWREQRGERFAELQHIKQPTLVVNGSHDIMVPTINSYILSQRIPDAQLILYPGSGHGSLFQYAELFVTHASRFLDAAVAFT